MNVQPDKPVSAEDLRAVTAAYVTKSDRIRALARKAYARARIADALGVKYQFVRNVLEDDARLGRAPPSPGVAETPAPPFAASRSGPALRLRVEPDGMVRLPPEVMESLGVKTGGILISRLEGEILTVLGPREAIRRVQAEIAALNLAPGRILSEELIQERRAEAAKEAAEEDAERG